MDRLKKLIKTIKSTKFIVSCGILGLVLIMVSSMDLFDVKPKQAEQVDFEVKTEQQISNIVCRITGEKSVGVMVSLDSTGEIVYADAKSISKNNITDNLSQDKYKTEQTDDTEQNYIIIENADGGEEALIISKLSPTVKGVVVVTKYGDNSAVAERIISAVTTALNISEKKVCVVSGN